MKKALLVAVSVSALGFVSADARADQPALDLGLSGYMGAYGVYSDQDETGAADSLRSFDFRKNTEVHLDGEVALDNGITAGAHLELLTDRADATTMEESYLHVSSDFGRVEFGETDGVGTKLQVTAPSADPLVDGVSPKIGVFTAANGGTIDYKMNPAGYANKVSYFTPVLNGFQVGASFTPTVGADLGSFAVAQQDDDAGERENLWEIAGRYQTSFHDFDMKAGAAYQSASLEANGGANDDFEEWGAGLAVGYGALDVGVFYSLNDSVVQNNDTNLWVFGANYTMGAYKFGASYLNTQTDDPAGAADTEVDRYTLGVIYEWGPGMTFRTSVQRQEAQNVGNVAGADGDGTQVLMGTVLNF